MSKATQQGRARIRPPAAPRDSPGSGCVRPCPSLLAEPRQGRCFLASWYMEVFQGQGNFALPLLLSCASQRPLRIFIQKIVSISSCSCDEPRLPPLQAELPQENARRWGPPGGITATAHNLGALEVRLKLRVSTSASVSLVHHTLA